MSQGTCFPASYVLHCTCLHPLVTFVAPPSPTSQGMLPSLPPHLLTCLSAQQRPLSFPLTLAGLALTLAILTLALAVFALALTALTLTLTLADNTLTLSLAGLTSILLPWPLASSLTHHHSRQVCL